MAKFDFKKGLSNLKDASKQAGKVMTKTAKQSGQVIGGMANTIRTANPKDISENIGTMAVNSGKAFTQFVQDSIQTTKDAKNALNEENSTNVKVSLMEALKVMYLLANIDEDFSIEEKETINSILEDSAITEEQKQEIILQARHILEEAKQDDYEEVIRENVVLILKENNSSDQEISKNLFLWNLLTLAKCDEDYSNKEKKLINTVVRTLDIDKSILPEMEMAYDTIQALEFANTKDREYKKEIIRRKKIIMQSVYQLIEDKEA